MRLLLFKKELYLYSTFISKKNFLSYLYGMGDISHVFLKYY